MSLAAMNLDPNKILVLARQRSTPGSVDTLANSIREFGQIHPIVVRSNPDNPDAPILVVGLTRRDACIKLGIPVSATFLEDLDAETAEEMELEENVKRTDISWRDHVQAIKKISDRRMARGENRSQVCKHFGIKDKTTLSHIRTLAKNLDNPALQNATGISQAISILQVISDRKAAEIVEQIGKISQQLIGARHEPHEPHEPESELRPKSESLERSAKEQIRIPPAPTIPNNVLSVPSTASPVIPSGDPNISPEFHIIQTDFLEWLKTYSGQKFNLIHCDFPYDIDYSKYARSVTSTSEDYDFRGFWRLLDALLESLDKIASYQSHLMFWFSMDFYDELRKKLETAGLFVHKHPLVWYKTDNSGIIPGRDNQYPRRVYETALLASRGRRPLIRSLANAYGAPIATGPGAIHPSQKPEPVLNHFFSMLVDETTDVLDPTCGSGTAIRSAERCGARCAIGLEVNPNYARSAELLTQNRSRLAKRDA